MVDKNFTFNMNVRRISLMAMLSVVYVICTFIPISPFIGGPSLLTLNLIIVPMIALTLNPIEAFITSLIGGLITLWVVPMALANIFGPSVLLLPVLGSTMGSLSKYKAGKIIVGPYLVFCIFAFIHAIPEFPYWITPHMLAVILCPVAEFIKNIKLKVTITAFVSTMCEQAIMMILAVYQVQLPWQVFAAAFPFMIYERALAVIGGSILTLAVSRIVFVKEHPAFPF